MTCVFIVHLTLRMLLQIEKDALIQQLVISFCCTELFPNMHLDAITQQHHMTEMFHRCIKVLCTQSRSGGTVKQIDSV